MDAMQSSSATYHVAWIDAASRAGFGRGVLEEAEHIDGGTAGDYPATGRLSVPRMPVNLLRPSVIQNLNRFWWRRAPRDGISTNGFRAFFHPLDAVQGWPGLYGPNGLVQWQLVVPDDACSFIEMALRTLADTVTAPALVVLKRMGPGRAGALSYPLPGWSMAVDLPAHPNVAPVLDRLDTILAAAGGRVYLAKDCRLARPTFERMYPELGDWRAARHELDPRGVFTSDLGRRLGLS
jgi:decaprenylphospho-beta-D-ribofuranose 2-oxidase